MPPRGKTARPVGKVATAPLEKERPPSPAPPAKQSGPTARTGLHVTGSMLRLGDGRAFYVHGVDRPSLEWSCQGQGIAGGPIPASDFATMSSVWMANTVRLSLNEVFWLSAEGVLVGTAWRCPTYRSAVLEAVRDAEAAGLRVILDLHWSDAGNALGDGVGQSCMADGDSVRFWTSVATLFASDSSVMFELYNEPHDITWGVWRNGGPITCGAAGSYQAVGMQQLVNVVRATGADNVVLVGGDHWAGDLSGVSTPLEGDNIAYAVHPYEENANANADEWNAHFGNLAARFPVVATEFGNLHCQGADRYLTDLLDYLRAKSIGYTAWAWWAGGCSFPSLVTDPGGGCAGIGCPIEQDLRAVAAGTRRMGSSDAAALTVGAGAKPTASTGGACDTTAARPPTSAASGASDGPFAFDFEDGALDGWQAAWGSPGSFRSTDEIAWSGRRSLVFGVCGAGYPAIDTASRIGSLSPGDEVFFHVWAPAGVAVGARPWVEDSHWLVHFDPTITALNPGWNTLRWLIPPESGVNVLGMQVEDPSGWTGPLALDAIGWAAE